MRGWAGPRGRGRGARAVTHTCTRRRLPNGFITAPLPERLESLLPRRLGAPRQEGPRRRTKKKDQGGRTKKKEGPGGGGATAVPQYRSPSSPGISMKTVRVDGEESRSLSGASGHRFTGGRRGAVRPTGRGHRLVQFRSPWSSFTLSLFHSFTLSFSLTVTFSLSISHCHSLILSLSHSLTLSFVSLDSPCSFFITLFSWFLLFFTERVHWVFELILINYE